MAWVYLIAGGFLEIAWAFGLQQSEGFSQLWPSVITLALLGASFALFARALRFIEIGVAYAVFTGIGTAGTVLVGMAFLHEPVSILQLLFVALLIAGIIGLKVISGDAPDSAAPEGGR